MKKIINGKRYDTDTAQLIGRGDNDFPVNDFNYFQEELYLKKTGEYFIYGRGGGLSKYAELIGYSERRSGEKITPITEDEAKEWAEEYLTAEEYEQAFEVSDEDTAQLTVHLPVSLAEKVREAAIEEGLPISKIIERALQNS